MCLSVVGSQASAPQKTTKSKWSRDLLYEKRQFLGNGNTWAYSDLPAVDILNIIQKAATAMWPLATTFVGTCLFCCFSGSVYRAVLMSCDME